jgi:uncharacterized RDD family membrane protein YckC
MYHQIKKCLQIGGAMSRYVHFTTPENIEISYELAGAGSRFLAAAIDLCLQLVLIIGLSIVGSLLAGITYNRVTGGNLPAIVIAILILLVFLILTGYYAFFEIIWAGRTPGKKLVGLRVVRDGGWPVDPYAAIVRNLVRIVDILPPPYGIGLISMFFSSDYKRLGDWAAGTIVIKEHKLQLPSERRMAFQSPMMTFFLDHIPSVDGVSPEEYQAIHRFNERRHELDIPVQAHIAMRMAFPIMHRLGLDFDIPVQWHYADLLEAIERRYVEERSLL